MKIFLFLIIIGSFCLAGCSQVQSPQTDTTPPSAPKDLYALPDDKEVYLHFTGTLESDIYAYNVYRSETSGAGFVKVGTVFHEGYSDYSFTDTGLTNGKTYYYKVTSVDKSGNESGYSGEVNGIPLGCSYLTWPTTNRLNDIYFVSENDGWAVGENKTILHYNGSNWLSVVAPAESNPYASSLTSLYFVSSNNGWLCTSVVGEVWHYDGVKWSVFATLKDTDDWDVELNTIYFISSNDGWVGGERFNYSGYIAHFNGVTWESFQLPAGIGSIQAISFISSNNGWAIDGSGNILHYNGTQWIKENVSAGSLKAMGIGFTLPPSFVWLGENNGNLFSGYYYDGTNWYYLPIGGIKPMYDLFMLSSREGWAVGQEQIWRCWDGRWYEMKNPQKYSLWAIFFTSRTKGWGISTEGKIYKFE